MRKYLKGSIKQLISNKVVKLLYEMYHINISGRAHIVPFSRITAMANVTFSHGRRLLLMMIDEGLVVKRKLNNRANSIELTDTGMKVAERLVEVLNLLN